jgi:hypothetical protein
MRGIGVIMALFSAGCSLGFVAGPPPQHAQVASFTCSDSNLAPILDSVFAGLTATISLGAASTTDEKWAMDNANLGSRTTAAIVYGGFAALTGASAYYGYHTVHACREARQLASDRVQHALQTLPASWPPPPGAAAPGATPPAPPAPPVH